MKTIKKKNPVLEFDRVYLDYDTAQTYEVSLGTQRLGHVCYEGVSGHLFVTDVFVDTEFERFGVESQILDALLASEENHTIQVVVPLSSVSQYEEAGFVCDPTNVLMQKTK